jgi:ssDNA-binding Zn-finger/Zn-ribbon topoisomerase 1
VKLNVESARLRNLLFNVPVTQPPVDPELVVLSRKLTARLPITEKAGPIGQPSVWADGRQALCETVPYFKTPQGGCHQNDGHVYAFYFDSVGHCREYMDTDVIIARSGGGMEMDKDRNLLQSRDHEYQGKSKQSKGQVEAVLNNIRHKNPIVIICGDRNEGALCRMPHKFCVLGWYKPIAVWTEKTLGKGGRAFRTIKYRFERLGSKDAWFAPKEGVSLTGEDYQLAGPLTYASCARCRKQHPQMYLEGWMCLTYDCESLWKVDGKRDAPYGRLEYNPAYLLQRTPWSNEQEPYDVRVPIPDVGNYIGDNLSYINTRGICCPKCGKCNSRRYFKGWKCENRECDWERFPKHFTVRPAQLHSPWDTFGDGPSLGRNTFDEANVKLAIEHYHGMKIYRYTFNGVEGSLTHITSNARLNAAANGPNDMLAALQQQDDPELELPLERRIFAGTGVKKTDAPKTDVTSEAARLRPEECPILNENRAVCIYPDNNSRRDHLQEGDFMSSYSINYGMPYKFIASGSSLPFEKAPWPVRSARADLNWASQNILGQEGHIDFNEQLIFAYLEKQKLEYHDDGEKGLGPRIATLSLGASARMHLRMKHKHFVGCSKTGIFTSDKPIPGCKGGDATYQQRLEAWHALEQLRESNRAQYIRRQKEIPRELGMYQDRNKVRAGGDLVVLTLNHGDMVLMEGRQIQQYFEHKVQSEGYLRFALTCRTVLGDHLKPDEMPAFEVSPDEHTISNLAALALNAAGAQQQQQQLA